MSIQEIGPNLTPQELQKINVNFQQVQATVASISGEVLNEVITQAQLIWREPVTNFAALSTSYPTPEPGWTAMARDSGKVYRYTGTSWGEIQQIDAGPMNELDTRLTADLADKGKRLNLTNNNLKVFAHRGAESFAPENTIKAFEVAEQLNFDGWELDVLFTSDGVPVVHHDDTVDRMTNGTGRVDSLTYAQIQALTIDGGLFPNWHIGLKIPSLESVLRMAKKYQREVLVEMKSMTTTQVQTVENLIVQLGMTETAFILAPYGIANILESIGSPLKTYIFYVNNAEYQTALSKSNVVGVCVYPHTLCTPEIVKYAHDRGRKVNVATVLSNADVAIYNAMGVDSVTGGNYRG